MNKNWILWMAVSLVIQARADVRTEYFGMGKYVNGERQWSYRAYDGTVEATFDDAGNNLGANRYGAFGARISNVGEANDREAFQGQDFREDVNHYNLGVRNMAPDEGRWLQPEPMLIVGIPTNRLFQPLHFNPYRYAGNDPVLLEDSKGMMPALVVAGAWVVGGLLVDHTLEKSGFWAEVESTAEFMKFCGSSPDAGWEGEVYSFAGDLFDHESRSWTVGISTLLLGGVSALAKNGARVAAASGGVAASEVVGTGIARTGGRMVRNIISERDGYRNLGALSPDGIERNEIVNGVATKIISKGDEVFVMLRDPAAYRELANASGEALEIFAAQYRRITVVLARHGEGIVEAVEYVAGPVVH